jgi:DNA-binding transcriptional MerR regulator
MAGEFMTISEISKKFDVSEDTLRYYEKIGLVTAHRRESGIRDYQEDDIKRLEFVKCMRNAGMEIEPLQRYLKLIEQGQQHYRRTESHSYQRTREPDWRRRRPSKRL